MMKMYGNGSMGMPTEQTLVLNTKNALVDKLCARIESNRGEELTKMLAKQIYLLSLVAMRPLEADELSEFISQNTALLSSID